MALNYAGFYTEETGELYHIPLKSVHIRARIVDSVSLTTIEQVYYNNTECDLEAIYKFPIIPNAAVCGFEFEVNGNKVKGIVEEVSKAKTMYEDAKNTSRMASLLSQIAGDVFQLKVVNISPKTDVKVKITYTHELPSSSISPDELVYTVPTTIAPRYDPSPNEPGPSSLKLGSFLYFGSKSTKSYTLKLTIDVQMSTKITLVSSSTHSIKFKADARSPCVGCITFANADVQLDKDVVITLTSEKLDQPTTIVEIDETNNTKCVMLTFVPRFKAQEIKTPEFIFLIDRSFKSSGSMSGKPIENTAVALTLLLRSLPPDSLFNIVSFGDAHASLFPLPSARYTSENMTQAMNFCSQLKADMGGTEIFKCLQTLFSSWSGGQDTGGKRDRQIFLLTDGEISNTSNVIHLVREEYQRNQTRFFALGIGDSVSHALCDGVARVGRGDVQYIIGTERLEKKVIALLKKSLHRAMDNVQITWIREHSTENQTIGHVTVPYPQSSFEPPKLQQSPFVLPPIFPMTRFTCYLIAPTSTTLESPIKMVATSQEGELSVDVSLNADIVHGQMIHRLAARRLLTDFEDRTSYLHAWQELHQPSEVKLHELVCQQALELAKKYTLAVDPHTSFVAISENNPKMNESQRPKLSVVVPLINPLDDDMLVAQFCGNPSPGAVGGGGKCYSAPPRSKKKAAFGPSIKLPSITKSFSKLKSKKQSTANKVGPVTVPRSSLQSATDKSEVETQILAMLLQHQKLTGEFLHTSLRDFVSFPTISALQREKLVTFNPALKGSDNADVENCWATIIGLLYMEKRLKSIREEWVLVHEKAMKWVIKCISDGKEVEPDSMIINEVIEELKKDGEVHVEFEKT